MSTPTLFNRYHDIAISNKSNHRIVLDGDNSQDKGPKALSLWGRFVQACKDLFKSKDDLTADKAAVLSNFEKALHQKYSSEEAITAKNELDRIKGTKKSLRARDVRKIISIVANNAIEHQIEDENLKTANESTQQAKMFAHKNTDKSVYYQYYFDKNFPERIRYAEARLITTRKDPQLTTGLLDSDPSAKDKKIAETKLADKYVILNGQDNLDALQLLSEIGVDFTKLPTEYLCSHFIAVYNSIVDNGAVMPQSKLNISLEGRILQQQELLKAMIKDPSLASKILDYFDKITSILTHMRDVANDDDSNLFAQDLMKLICIHNGFAKFNDLDDNLNFDQMLTVAVHVGFSRLSADVYHLHDIAFRKLISVLFQEADNFMSELRSNENNFSSEQGIIADENIYGAYQHLPKSMDWIEYSRCPVNVAELTHMAKIFLPVNIPFISDFEDFDWKNSINEGINGYMQSELEMSLT